MKNWLKCCCECSSEASTELQNRDTPSQSGSTDRRRYEQYARYAQERQEMELPDRSQKPTEPTRPKPSIPSGGVTGGYSPGISVSGYSPFGESHLFG